MRKKFLSLLLSFAMLLSLLPATAWAAETTSTWTTLPAAGDDQVIRLNAEKTTYELPDGYEVNNPIEVSATKVTLKAMGVLNLKAPITVLKGGALTISGSGNVGAAAGFTAPSGKDCMIKNDGTMLVTGGVTITGADSGSSVITNGGTLYIGDLDTSGDATVKASPANDYVIDNRGILEIQGNAKINGMTGTSNCILSSGDQNLTQLTVRGGTISGGEVGIAVCTGTANTIAGGTISGSNTGITVSGKAGSTVTGSEQTILTVSGGTISGNTGIEVSGGGLTVSGGSISGQSGGTGIHVRSPLESAKVTIGQAGADNSNLSVSGTNALYFDSISTAIEADVFSGTFTGSIARAGNSPKEFISGGVFSNNSAGAYLGKSPEGNSLELVGPLDDGLFHIILAGNTNPNDTNNVAHVQSKNQYYHTLDAAVAAAGDGDVIRLVKDCSESSAGSLSIKKKLEINLSGFYLFSRGPITVGKGGDLTITGSGKERESVINTLSTAPQTVVVEDGGSLTVNNATIMNQLNSGSDVASAILIKGSTSTATIKNGKVQAEGTNGVGVKIDGGSFSMPKSGTGPASTVAATNAGGIGVWVGGSGKFTAEEGSITAAAERGCAIFKPDDDGSIDVSDCEIKGVIGVAVRNGKVNLNNCIIQTVEFTSSEENGISVGAGSTRYSFRPAGVVFNESVPKFSEITITGGEILAYGNFPIRYAVSNGTNTGTYYYETDDEGPTGSGHGAIVVEGNGQYTGLFSGSVSPFVNSAYKFEADSNGYRYYTLLSDAVAEVANAGIDGTVKSLDKESPVYNIRLYLDKLSNNTLSTPFGTLFKQGSVAYYVDANTKAKQDVGESAADWPAAPAERVGYSFGGWYTISGDTQIVWSGGNSTTVKSLDEFLKEQATDISLCARWDKDGAFRADSVGGTAYPTLAAALENATAGVYIYTVDGDVALTQDIPAEISQNVYITGLDHNFTLNLNRNQLKFTGGHGLVINSNASTVTVTNGTIESEGTAVTVNGSNRVYIIDHDAVTGSRTGAIAVTGTSNGIEVKNGTLTVGSGAKITGTTNGIDVTGGTLTVEGGEISGGKALNFAGGTGKITGGTFTGTGSGGKSVVVSGSNPTGFIYGGTFLTVDEDGKTAPDMMAPDREAYIHETSIQLDTGAVVPKEGYVVIEFDPKGGAFGEDHATVTKTAAKGSALSQIQPSDPTYAGHAFLGWYKEESGGEKLSPTYRFTEDTKLYAHWGYPITFDARPGGFKDGAYAITADTGEDGILGKLPDDPIHDKYTFAGWYIVGEDTKPVDLVYNHQFTKDTTVYAHWGYKVTFDANGGTLDGDKTAMTDEDGVLPEDKRPSDPERNGFVFDGWYMVGEDTKLDFAVYQFTKDTTVTAQWTKDPNSPVYVITFDATPGVFTGGSHTVTKDTGEDSILKSTDLPANPTLSGYTFGYWYEVDEDTEVNFTYAFKKDTTLHAHWTKNEDPVYTITFDANGGTLTNTTATTNGDGKLSELPTPTRDNHTFDGWYTETEGGTEITTDTVFTKDTTVYAHWTKKSDSNDPGGEDSGDIQLSYFISIASSNHGKVIASSMSAKSGSTVTLTVQPDTDYEVESVEIRPVTGSSIWRYPGGDSCSFVMPTADVTVYATFSLRPEYSFVPPQQTQSPSQTNTHTSLPASAFTPPTWRPAVTMKDVPASSWAYPAAQWAYQNGYLDTAADGTFRLNDTVSHMQLWRIMAQWLGETALDDNSVTQWARKSGASRISISPSGVMTRQNMVEYLYQCYFLMGGDVSVSGNLIQYRDGQQVTSGSAKNAWLWAVNKGIISGTTDGYLNPNKVLTRAEFATILMRLCQNG